MAIKNLFRGSRNATQTFQSISGSLNLDEFFKSGNFSPNVSGIFTALLRREITSMLNKKKSFSRSSRAESEDSQAVDQAYRLSRSQQAAEISRLIEAGRRNL